MESEGTGKVLAIYLTAYATMKAFRITVFCTFDCSGAEAKVDRTDIAALARGITECCGGFFFFHSSTCLISM